MHFLDSCPLEARAYIRSLFSSNDSKAWVASKIPVSKKIIETNQGVPLVTKTVSLSDVVKANEHKLASISVSLGGENVSLYSLANGMLMDLPVSNPGMAAMAYSAIEKVLMEECKDTLAGYQPIAIDPIAGRLGAYVDAGYVASGDKISAVRIAPGMCGVGVKETLAHMGVFGNFPVSQPPPLFKSYPALALSWLLTCNASYREKVAAWLKDASPGARDNHLSLMAAAMSPVPADVLLKKYAKRFPVGKEQILQALLFLSNISYSSSERGREERAKDKVSNEKSKLFMNMFNSDAIGILYELEKTLPPLDDYDHVVVKNGGSLGFIVSLLKLMGAQSILFHDDGEATRLTAARAGCSFVRKLESLGENIFIIDLSLTPVSAKEASWSRWDENKTETLEKLKLVLNSKTDMMFRFPFPNDSAGLEPIRELLRLTTVKHLKLACPYRLHRPYVVVSTSHSVKGEASQDQIKLVTGLLAFNFSRVQVAEAVRAELIRSGCSYLDELYAVRQDNLSTLTMIIKVMTPKFIVIPKDTGQEEVPEIELPTEGDDTPEVDYSIF
jgi:hypothetical protein